MRITATVSASARLRASIAGFVTVLAAILAVGAGAAQAKADGCDTSWASPTDGDWNDPANWDNGLPGADRPDACVDLPGTYTVRVAATEDDPANATATAEHLHIGGPSGQQTLELIGQAYYNEAANSFESIDATLNLRSGTVGPMGRIEFGDTGCFACPGAQPGVTIEASDGLVNEGTIYVDPGAGGERRVVGSLRNRGTVSLPNRYTTADGARDGKLDIDGDYSQDPSGSLLIAAGAPASKFDAHASKLGVSGVANLGGSLGVSSFGPAPDEAINPGARFRIIAAGAQRIGRFSDVSLGDWSTLRLAYGGSWVDLVDGPRPSPPKDSGSRSCKRAHDRLSQARSRLKHAHRTENRRWIARTHKRVVRARQVVDRLCR